MKQPVVYNFIAKKYSWNRQKWPNNQWNQATKKMLGYYWKPGHKKKSGFYLKSCKQFVISGLKNMGTMAN